MTLTDSIDDTPERVSRVDMHCHSTASQVSKLGVQRAAGLPECATPPEEVYALAKRRGMDFVTITDHDTIDGAMQIARPPRRVRLRGGSPRASVAEPTMQVHVLCYDITPEDHDWLQGNALDVELCAAYMYGRRDIACALAHPYYIVGAPLTARHRRRLAELFGVWGSPQRRPRARGSSARAATYVATRDSIGIGGSDDHAGVDIGRTYTQAPAGGDTARVPCAHARRAGTRPRRAGQRRRSGRTPRSSWPRARSEPEQAHAREEPEDGDTLVAVAPSAQAERSSPTTPRRRLLSRVRPGPESDPQPATGRPPPTPSAC